MQIPDGHAAQPRQLNAFPHLGHGQLTMSAQTAT
jgi:hypothetical protein